MDGKRKKNKKKKGNSQSKLADASVEEVAVMEQDNGLATQLIHIPNVPSTTDVQSVGVSESDMELDRHNVYEERFVKLHEEVRQLEDVRNRRLQKEASLDGKIELLQSDVESWIRNEASLEEKLKNLQNGNDILIQKEAFLEDRVKHIEGIKDLWISKETLIRELDSRFAEINSRLQEEVKELKGSRDGLLQENAQMRESIAMMESRVHRMEIESFLSRSLPKTIAETPMEKIPEYHSEAAPPPLEEKREPEKTEVVEKAMDVRIDSHQHAAADNIKNPDESVISIDYTPGYTEQMHESGSMVPSLTRARNPFNTHDGVDDFGSLNGVRQGHLLGMDNPRISEDIVSVPLDDVHVQEIEPRAVEDEETSLPMSDAPLVGAPFRLISFFAKYVSGADLVHQDGGRSG